MLGGRLGKRWVQIGEGKSGREAKWKKKRMGANSRRKYEERMRPKDGVRGKNWEMWKFYFST